ncbi:MAG: sugar phosphate isomerase/epimerase family protein [bacterium]
MNKIGIRAHDLGTFSAGELAAKVRAHGFDAMQLVFTKALTDPVDFTNLTPLATAFSDVEITMLGAYFNPVHPDPEVVAAGCEYFEKVLDSAGVLHALCVGTETGSLMGSPWGYVPENHAPATLARVIDIVRRLTAHAAAKGNTVAIEGAWAHVAYTPERLHEIIAAVASPHVKAIVDLYNYLTPENHESRMEILDRCFTCLKDDILLFHLKDYIVKNGRLCQVGLGQGLMDFPAIITRICKQTPGARLIFEGVTGADIATSFALISDLVRKEQ